MERAFREVGRPAALAYAQLSSHSSRIRKTWEKLLERYGVCGTHITHLTGLHLMQRFREFTSGNAKAYIEHMEHFGLELARKGVPAECVAVAITLYVDSCLGDLKCDDAQKIRWIRSLMRWASVSQFVLMAGYARHAASETEAREKKVALAEDRAQNFSVELANAYEKERRRLAQDLHDEIGHDLIVLKLYTEVIALDLNKGEVAQVRRKLKQSVSLIKHALRGVRHLTFDLGPAVWSEEGFSAAVKLYGRQFAHRTGLKVRLSFNRLKLRLSPAYETALYKVLQGALSNIAAHADAKHVRVTLSSRKDAVVMRVEDDGKGFDVSRKLRAPPNSYGLRAMRDRIELLGGSINFASRRGRKGIASRGTAIEIALPVHGLEAL